MFAMEETGLDNFKQFAFPSEESGSDDQKSGKGPGEMILRFCFPRNSTAHEYPRLLPAPDQTGKSPMADSDRIAEVTLVKNRFAWAVPAPHTHPRPQIPFSTLDLLVFDHTDHTDFGPILDRFITRGLTKS